MHAHYNFGRNAYQSIWKYMMILAIAAGMPSAASGAVPIQDEDITFHVEKELLLDPGVPFNAIDVATHNGIVTVSGDVTDLLAKQRTTRVAETVRGVRSVVNRIKVDPVFDRSGRELSNAVNAALLYDAATDSYDINVTANAEGHVTLNGSVDSWAARSLAGTVAKGVNGVTSISNKIRVKSRSTRPDDEIKPEIKSRLHWDAMVDDGQIDVEVDDGKVTLSGTVGSAAEKRRAEDDALVSAVRSVDAAKLKVQKWANNPALRNKEQISRSDPEIRKAIISALNNDPRVSSFNIDVMSAEGAVALRGVVDNIQAKQSAIHDARHTTGVKSVNSLIKVRPVSTLSSGEAASNIRDALLRNPDTEGYKIDVHVKNHVAYLDGTVDTYMEKAEAENIAYRAEGITDVKNNLDVSNPDIVVNNPYVYNWSIYDYPWYGGSARVYGKSDWQITHDISDELIWSPFVDKDEVTVSVENGIATLTGTVDSWSEYYAARENAFEGGAITVVNRLKVD